MNERKFPEYNPQAIEPKWQRQWEEVALYHASEGGNKPKFYCMDFFPYPSGDGLHVGHCRNYVPTDTLSRFKRMQGYNVLHPMGWDAFGEPAEQYAVAHGVHPRVTTDRNTANFRRQMTLIGESFDWSREIDSSDPDYYRWTQWFFLMLYRRGLAYRDLNWQWWCPTCMTTLSSHEVDGGVCWRGHTGVVRRQIPAWYFRITAYADRLLEGLEQIDWPEHIKAMQRNWIGRSEGMRLRFPFAGENPQAEGVDVFTTRPDTLFGVTFMVLAPEHPLVERLVTSEQCAHVEAYQQNVSRMADVERMDEARPKTGVFTGGCVTHPLTGAAIPVWVADYVLPGYGTGAVMGVPAHDQRDFEFAHKFGLGVCVVIEPVNVDGNVSALSAAYTGDGRMVNSGQFDGLDNRTAIQSITSALVQRGLGKPTVQYRMRDWLISRQRYWGAPIPIVHCPACGEVPVPEEQLPVRLPPMDNFTPDGTGASPLRRVAEFLHTTCPKCGGPAERETDTMGGFACSSWYFLRFTSPDYKDGPFDPARMQYWMPVNLYVGGAEHAVLHLLYSRFWVKVMYDSGLLDFDEPFARLLNQGQLMGPDGKRMSKSRGNVITPDNVAAEYGADALRVYVMFMAPFDQEVAWSTDGIIGARRFLNRVWSLVAETYAGSGTSKAIDPDLERRLHRCIRQVTERNDALRFNTMISALMEFSNLMVERRRSGRWQTQTYHQALNTLLLLLAPAAPHITEELWQLTGHKGSIHRQAWPVYDPVLAELEMVEIAVQVDGKVRVVLTLPAEATKEEVETAVLGSATVQRYLQGRQVLKSIVAPGKIVNFVTTIKKKV